MYYIFNIIMYINSKNTTYVVLFKSNYYYKNGNFNQNLHYTYVYMRWDRERVERIIINFIYFLQCDKIFWRKKKTVNNNTYIEYPEKTGAS